ncbi:hypothetical protein LCGC14_1041010 [marine sediment metagenome]|uniref:Uncharacterized protein n=1 Tax=marine sediment metagenome TaxID=412755 RepID=A0A0F9MRK4_9ZZZZ
MSKDKVEKSAEEESFTDAVGTPTAMLLPARNYRFKVQDNNYSITIPRKGLYTDLDPKIFSADEGEFDLLKYDKSARTHTLYMPAISKILFATSQYPDLKDGEAFTPIAMVFKRDEVEIIGNVIEMVPKEK